MIAEAVEEFEGAEAGSSKSQINQALSGITKLCQTVVAGKYPFARDVGAATRRSASSRSSSAPMGLMDKFFAEHLAPITDISGEAWDWQKDTRLGRELSVDTLRQFQRAAEIRSAFFPDGGPVPNVQLTIAPHTISRDADMALLEINQVVVQTSLAGNAPVSFTWPGNGGSGTANISLYPEMPGRETRLGREGPWALMRLIDAGKRHAARRRTDRPLCRGRARSVVSDPGWILLQSALSSCTRRTMPGASSRPAPAF